MDDTKLFYSSLYTTPMTFNYNEQEIAATLQSRFATGDQVEYKDYQCQNKKSVNKRAADVGYKPNQPKQNEQ